MANINGRLMGLLNRECNAAFSAAIDYCERRGLATLGLPLVVDQLVRAERADVEAMLDFAGVDRGQLATDLERALRREQRDTGAFKGLTSEVLELVRESWLLCSVRFGESRIRSGHLLLEMLDDPHLAKRLRDISETFAGLDARELTERFAHVTAGSVEESLAQAVPLSADDAAAPSALADGTALQRFGHDLVAEALGGGMDPILGRDREIREMITSLLRRRQNNPILIGEAGVGKTAVVEGLAQRIAAGDVPPPLTGAALVALDIGLLQAGASMKGEFEQRLKQVIDEVQSSERLVILFIDEAHTLIGAGGAAGTGDAANLLKPALARGTLRTVAATTLAEYKAHIEPDPALVRRFQPVRVEEPDIETAIRMMRGVSPAMSRHHGVTIDEAALRASVELAARYIPSRQLPDKSIGLLDTAAARVAVSRHTTPAPIERLRAELTANESELAALATEARTGGADGEAKANAEERREALERACETFRAELAVLEARWANERELVGRIDAAIGGEDEARAEAEGAVAPSAERAAIEAGGGQGPNPETDDRSATDGWTSGAGALKAELEALQDNAPLVFAGVDRHAIAAVVEDWTGIPLGRVLASELATVLELGTRLAERVIGQDHALEAIAENIRTSRAGLDRENRPTAVFMFAGTSGVGKTETAKALAELLYGGERKLVTVNMSEFKTPETVTTLKGPPPGYVGNERGGILTEAVRRNPYSVVLLDEIEKAHPDVNELFFRVFDEGLMEDSNGVTVDFRNTVIILTTNAGTELVMAACQGGAERPPVESIAAQLQAPLEARFSPAFMGRVQLIPFYPLDPDALGRIARLQLERVRARLAKNRRIALGWTEEVVDHIVARCDNPEAGGRAIDAILNRGLLPAIGRELLERAARGAAVDRIDITLENGGFRYRLDGAKATPAESEA